MVNHLIAKVPSWAFVALMAVGNLTCNEALPPFENLGTVIKAGVIRARYVLVVDDNSMEITLSVRHLYDETFEGMTNLNGSVTIALPRLQSVHKTVLFNYTSLTTNQKYNTTTKILRFDPGDTLIFRIRWDFVDDNGDSLKNTAFRYYADPNCPFRCIAEEEVFSLTASLRLFDEVPAAAYGPVPFSVCHVTNWIDSQVCAPINVSSPCSYFPSARIPCDSTTS
ncbi:MAG TPA: hypothetical protein VJN65_03715 [Bacteroidota bacterium]|nr:hypothetical protein [Bacteroidota bacterium]